MNFVSTPLQGAFLVEIAPVSDDRGFFARTWSIAAARDRDLIAAFDEHSVSFNAARGTLRGMHFQAPPAAETKLVRCTAGAIYDVILDLRPDSPTYRRWYSAELTAENRTALYVPTGVAHGFLTLQKASEVLYQISPTYAPALARGVRYDDPAFSIDWPFTPEVISERDRSYADYTP